jgi:hypothetical protein
MSCGRFFFISSLRICHALVTRYPLRLHLWLSVHHWSAFDSLNIQIKCTVPHILKCLLWKTGQQLITCITERRYRQGEPIYDLTKTVSLRSAYVMSAIRTVVTEVCILYASCLLLNGFSDTELRHCATSRKVAGSIPDGVTGIFH